MSKEPSIIPITVAYGDGIGPEIMKAVLYILEEAGARLDIHEVEIGEKVYLRGIQTGIEAKTWETLRHTKAFLKAPITTPQGGGFKSLNVTIRTTLGLYANVRPCISYAPFIKTKHPDMDVVIVRENEEDLYTGIEYCQTPEVCHSVKLISEPGSDKIIRYAFEYAQQNERHKVTCFTKDNIMKLSDGLFHRRFEEIASEYPEIESEHWIVDIGAAKLADTPENFDVIVMPNLYGDILSDVAAQISGSVGLAGSSNIGDFGAMFEAIHGSAPRRAGQNLANPSGLLFGAILMLLYIGQEDVATNIHNAWLKTIEEGIHTYDIFDQKVSKQQVGTKEFAEEVASRLGKLPDHFEPVHHAHQRWEHKKYSAKHHDVKRELVGIDLYLYKRSSASDFLREFTVKEFNSLELKMITNRGARIWPEGQPETFCVDQWRCRFIKKEGHTVSNEEFLPLLSKIIKEGFDLIKTENLYHFENRPAFSQAEG